MMSHVLRSVLFHAVANCLHNNDQAEVSSRATFSPDGSNDIYSS